MLAYGYPWNSKTQRPETLREATLCCTKEELDLLIDFLQEVRVQISELDQVEGEHWHLRDWKGIWSGRESDVILYLMDRVQER